MEILNVLLYKEECDWGNLRSGNIISYYIFYKCKYILCVVEVWIGKIIGYCLFCYDGK